MNIPAELIRIDLHGLGGVVVGEPTDALDWLRGDLAMAYGQEPVPWLGYLDDSGPFLLPHVYDVAGPGDGELAGPLSVSGERTIGERLAQEATFGEIAAVRDGVPDGEPDGLLVADGVATVTVATVSAGYGFQIAQAGEYDVAVLVRFPIWWRNRIILSLDGETADLRVGRFWWPYWGQPGWLNLGRRALAAGWHELRITGGIPGVEFHGFRVRMGFAQAPTAGAARFEMFPNEFRAASGGMVSAPDYWVTAEVERREPDSALVHFEDWQSYWVIPTNNYVMEGNWVLWRADM